MSSDKLAGGTERDRDGGLTSEDIETLEKLLEANKKFRRDAVKRVHYDSK